MSTVAARKRCRRRKLNPTLSFGLTRGGPSSLPSNMKANLLELFALVKVQLKPDVPGNATEAAALKRCSKDGVLATPETLDHRRTRSSSHTTEPLKWRKCEASASEVVVVETSFTGEHEVIVNEEPGPKALAESEVMDTLRQLREVLQEKGPSQEDDLLEAPNPSQPQLVLEVLGTLTTFLDRRPGFRVVHEDLYAFVYHHGPDDVYACFSTSLLQDGATTVCLTTRSNYSGRQHLEATDGGPRGARFSSSNTYAYESAVDRDDEEEERRQMQYGCSQAPWPPCLPRALQAVQQTGDPEAQPHELDPARFTELESPLPKRDAEIAELKERLETFRESQASEVQDLRVKIGQLLQVPPPAPQLSAAELKNCTAKKEKKPTGSNGAGAQVSPRPPQPRPPLHQMYPTPCPRPDEKPRSLPIDPRPRPLPPADTEVQEVRKVAADGRVPRTARRKMAQQTLKIVRMVNKQQPNFTDQEIRTRVDHLRRPQCGFSRMTFNAIVTLLLGNLKATQKEVH
ncbi:hypothetical protein HPB49_017568 [Dermacentor silvarum]|uniref:Uncharacterized protein n=1 Tax=Dermacentor silvarum TaxID=543639 RepID=A0ACB8D6W2_DERSI|nr:hypothetical protein HPB49_017568 [Dermacentor silvarum]